MDRRQRRTREAIFEAFIELLSKKHFNQITVGEIIDLADIGRATFYAHFETKDFLLKELCEERFDHVFEASAGKDNTHKHIFDCNATGSAFLHLLKHIQKNDNHILLLLSCQNNELFLSYFKMGLIKLIENQIALLELKRDPELPYDFWINHIASTFVETVRWWISDNKMKESPEAITKYFLLAANEKTM